MDILKNHFLSLVRVTEAASSACYSFIGKGQSKEADGAAVFAMREAFNKLPMAIRIVIGEGERDKAPRLYRGEELGDSTSSLKIDVAVDPLEGTTLCAHGKPGALSVMALGRRGDIFMAPDIYMKKIACGPKGKGHIHLDAKVSENLKNLAKALGKSVKELKVGVLNRDRHESLISKIRAIGALVYLVEDGDVALAIHTAFAHTPLDLLIGQGGAPEGVLAAAAMKCLEGDFQGQLVFKDKTEEQRALNAGVKDLHKVWLRDELIKGDTMFCATGVTSGDLLPGLSQTDHGLTSHSLILSCNNRWQLTHHHPSPLV